MSDFRHNICRFWSACRSQQSAATLPAARGSSGRAAPDEDSCSSRGDWRRRRRRQHAVSPGAEGLVGRGAGRARRADRRIDLACRRPAAAVQHELHRRPAAQVLGRSVQAPAGRNRPGRELSRDRATCASRPAASAWTSTRSTAAPRTPSACRSRSSARAQVANSGRWSNSATAPTRRRSSARSITPTTATSRRRTSRWRCARARAARGAEIHEQTEVTAVTRTRSGEWQVRTNKGDIVAEHVVCATGNYARQTGRMFGLNVPAIPVEHQYIVYDESPELKAYRQRRRPRAGGAARIRSVLLPARRAHGLDPGSLRSRCAGALRRRRAGMVRQEPVRGRPGAAAAACRSGAAARAGARELRHQGHRQRARSPTRPTAAR